MQEAKLDILILQPGEKVIGVAYLTPDDEIVFASYPGATEVVLVEPPEDSSGPWAVRRRPPPVLRAVVATP
jgi:hypothetical protein